MRYSAEEILNASMSVEVRIYVLLWYCLVGIYSSAWVNVVRSRQATPKLLHLRPNYNLLYCSYHLIILIILILLYLTYHLIILFSGAEVNRQDS